ncbi:MAG: hypothetical protein Q9M97_09435 [Candidatus Gracilibacteria bacterium]|nr:hypothetical protein [Candidatus Gracilibacteria bacterium]
MNKGYANSLGEICGNPIQSVDKMHLFIEANRVVDQVRDISRYTLQMNFIKVEDMAKLGKKCNEKLLLKILKNLIIVKIILKLRQGENIKKRLTKG